ncbi:MAG: hypothetical protein PHN56_01720 [Candidatus Nanoarchaeia archaeon]|nr:hypothetical protein [Candidatus Nanoarchaeia archaeon]
MKYSINQYFHEKSSADNSEKFFSGVEFFLKELGCDFEKNLKDYSEIKDLVCYRTSESIDCEMTRDSFRDYFWKNSLKKKEINIIYLDLPIIFIHDYYKTKISSIAIMDLLAVNHGLPFNGNIFVNSNYEINSKSFLCIGMHEISHIFGLMHCKSEKECLLKENRSNYNKCVKYFNYNNKMPFCNEHEKNFQNIKETVQKNKNKII